MVSLVIVEIRSSGVETRSGIKLECKAKKRELGDGGNEAIYMLFGDQGSRTRSV